MGLNLSNVSEFVKSLYEKLGELEELLDPAVAEWDQSEYNFANNEGCNSKHISVTIRPWPMDKWHILLMFIAVEDSAFPQGFRPYVPADPTTESFRPMNRVSAVSEKFRTILHAVFAEDYDKLTAMAIPGIDPLVLIVLNVPLLDGTNLYINCQKIAISSVKESVA